MVDDRAVKALKSKDAAIRKRAITALAKSADRDALPYLAKVAKSDPDMALRALARKGGAYIQKHAPQDDYGYDDYDDDYSYRPQEEYSKSYSNAEKDGIDQALDLYTIGQYAQAKKALGEALKKDRQRVYDDAMRSAAAQIYGTDPDTAMKLLVESINTKSAKKRRMRFPIKLGMVSFLMILVIVGGALVTGYAFFQPWLGSDSQLDVFSYTGMDIASNKDDVAFLLSLRNLVDAINAGDINAINSTLGMLETFERDALSFSMYLIPGGVVVLLVVVLLGMAETPGPVFWLGCLGLVVMIGIGFWWFDQGVDALFELIYLVDASALPIPGDALVASGFDIGRTGIIIMGGGGVLGLLTSFFVERD